MLGVGRNMRARNQIRKIKPPSDQLAQCSTGDGQVLGATKDNRAIHIGRKKHSKGRRSRLDLGFHFMSS